MGSFKDQKGQTWKVQLNPIVIQEIQEKHNIEIANLESDPMLKLRDNPMTLVSVIYLICQDEIESRGVGPKDFGKALPAIDMMLDAVKDAIVDFFPSGRSSHVREVLASYEEMSRKTDELQVAKMNAMIQNKVIGEKINEEADRRISAALDELFQASKSVGSSTEPRNSYT